MMMMMFSSQRRVLKSFDPVSPPSPVLFNPPLICGLMLVHCLSNRLENLEARIEEVVKQQKDDADLQQHKADMDLQLEKGSVCLALSVDNR